MGEVELDASFALVGRLMVPADLRIVRPRATDGASTASIRGQGPPALRRAIVNQLLSLGYEVRETQRREMPGPLPGPWSLSVQADFGFTPAGVLSADGQIVLDAEGETSLTMSAADGVHLGAGARVGGDVHSGGDVVVGAGAVVTGSVSCEGLLRVGTDARITGRVLCGGLTLAPGAVVAGTVRSRSPNGARRILPSAVAHGMTRMAPALESAPDALGDVTSLVRLLDRAAAREKDPEILDTIPSRSLFGDGQPGVPRHEPARPQPPQAETGDVAFEVAVHLPKAAASGLVASVLALADPHRPETPVVAWLVRVDDSEEEVVEVRFGSEAAAERRHRIPLADLNGGVAERLITALPPNQEVRMSWTDAGPRLAVEAHGPAHLAEMISAFGQANERVAAPLRVQLLPREATA